MLDLIKKILGRGGSQTLRFPGHAGQLVRRAAAMGAAGGVVDVAGLGRGRWHCVGGAMSLALALRGFVWCFEFIHSSEFGRSTAVVHVSGVSVEVSSAVGGGCSGVASIVATVGGVVVVVFVLERVRRFVM